MYLYCKHIKYLHTHDNTEVRADVSTRGDEITGMVWGGKEDLVCGKKATCSKYDQMGQVSFWEGCMTVCYLTISVLLGSIFQISKRKHI